MGTGETALQSVPTRHRPSPSAPCAVSSQGGERGPSGGRSPREVGVDGVDTGPRNRPSLLRDWDPSGRRPSPSPNCLSQASSDDDALVPLGVWSFWSRVRGRARRRGEPTSDEGHGRRPVSLGQGSDPVRHGSRSLSETYCSGTPTQVSLPSGPFGHPYVTRDTSGGLSVPRLLDTP